MRQLPAVPTYYILCFATDFFLWTIFTMNQAYQVTVVGLNPLQLVLVGTTLEAFLFIFEVPTGIVADVYSRRLSLVIGYVLMGMGFHPRRQCALLPAHPGSTDPVGGGLYLHQRSHAGVDSR